MEQALNLHSGRSAWVDALRPAHASTAVQVAAILFFVAATALGAQVRIYLWEVPITLQTLFVYGSGLFLGARNGLLSMLLYLTLGMFLPVFAGDGHGPSYLLAAGTAGYLLGMPLASLVTGALSRHRKSIAGSLLSVVAGSLTLFACGVTWLHFAAGHATWAESIEVGWLRFIVFDAIKVIMVAFAYSGLRRFLPRR